MRTGGGRWWPRALALVALGGFVGSPTRAPGAPPVERAAASAAALGTRPSAEGLSDARRAALERGARELATWVEREGGQLGLVAIRVGDGAVLAEHRADALQNPASNAKVLTAATALAVLGPEHRFSTGLYGRLRDGAVETLVLRGDGDPSLGTEHLERLVRAVRAKGLERVTGRILVDQSRFDDRFVPPAFEQQPDEWADFRAPVSAVALERNTIELNVEPTSPGEPARAWFHPPGFVLSDGRVSTADRGARATVSWALAPAGDRLSARLGGQVPIGAGRQRFARRVDDPRTMAGYVLSRLLEEHGIEAAVPVAAGGADVTDVITFHRSEPLSALLLPLGKESDNFVAEMLLKAVGAAATRAPGTSEAGAGAVEQWLRGVGAWAEGTRIRNGSGLFDANRVSARTLALALRAALRDPALSAEFVGQLSVGGVDGTLRSRFRDHRESRRIRAKTGTLARVVALSGYVLSADDADDSVAFALLVEGIASHGPVRQRLDRFVEALASAP